MGKMLTEKEAREIIGFRSSSSLFRVVKRGEIPCEVSTGKSGRKSYLFDEDDILKFMERKEKEQAHKGGPRIGSTMTKKKEEKEKSDKNAKEFALNVTGGTIMKDTHVDIAEDGMRFTAYGKPIGKDPKESNTPITPLDKRHLFADSNGFEKFVGDELEQKYKDCPEYTPKPFDEFMKEVKGLKQTIKLDGSTDIHIDIDARHITYQYVRSLTDEEFGIFIQKCVNDRLKRK